MSAATAAIVSQPEQVTDEEEIIQIVTPQLTCTATIISNRLILTAAHCLCNATEEGAVGDPPTVQLSTIEAVDANDTLFNIRVVAELAHSTYCSTKSTELEQSKDIAVLLTSRALESIVEPGTLAALSEGSWEHGFNPLSVTAYGYGYSDCETTAGLDTQRRGTFTLIHREETSTNAVLVPPGRDILSGTSLGDSGGPVYAVDEHSNRVLVGVVSGGHCPFHSAVALLDQRDLSRQLRVRIADAVDEECQTESLADCVSRGADYCVNPSGGPTCVRYVATDAACPDGYTERSMPDHYVEKPCLEESISPPPDRGGAIVASDGIGVDIVDGVNVRPHRYEGTTIDEQGARSNERGIVYIRIENRGAAELATGYLVVRSDAPLNDVVPHIDIGSPFTSAVTQHFVADPNQSGVGDWADSSSILNAAPVEENGQTYYYYRYRYYTVTHPELLLRADREFSTTFYRQSN